ncbi:MAG: T9SS type A sorting domain-containing protein [Clostridium sp.]|nr:T9SS type A sorting domain-containing protein [Clostridium sp.]
MKRIYTACLLAAAALSASAAGYRSLAVNQTDGTDVTIELTDEMSAWFEEGMFMVFGTSTEVSVPQTNIKSFTFSETSSLATVAADALVLEGGKMTFTNLPAGSVATVVNAAGQLVDSARPEGSWELDLAGYPAGVYMVTVNGVTYKIATKK